MKCRDLLVINFLMEGLDKTHTGNKECDYTHSLFPAKDRLSSGVPSPLLVFLGFLDQANA
jgi:hypothetical protein